MTTTESLTFAPMDASTRDSAMILLAEFLQGDAHYRASSAAYGDGGMPALARALELFLAQPELGCVWLARQNDEAVGACVVAYAISTSRGGIVAKLDDVTVRADRRGAGVGRAMLVALASWLRQRAISRIDCACHRDNAAAWLFYERLGFKPLDEERITWLLN